MPCVKRTHYLRLRITLYIDCLWAVDKCKEHRGAKAALNC